MSGIRIKESNFSIDGKCIVTLPDDLTANDFEFNDFVGIAFLNHYTQFPLIIHKTISADLKTITFPPDFHTVPNDILNVYIWRNRK